MVTIIKHKCSNPICKKHFEKPKGYNVKSKCFYCSRKCFHISRQGKNNNNWKGGRVLRNGYWSIKSLNHPYRDAHGYVFEHRLVMEKKLGRYLKPDELIHHKGIRFSKSSIENKQDNLSDNLELTTRSNHPKIHPRKRNKKGQFL